jgi:kynurenine formamidase
MRAALAVRRPASIDLTQLREGTVAMSSKADSSVDERTVGNWGRWGEEDERGAANLLTPEVVLSALKQPRRGVIYELGQPLQPKGQPRSPGLLGNVPPAPLHFWMRTGLDHQASPPADPAQTDFVMDYLATPVHGVTTHIDALGHAVYKGCFYNGHSAATSTPSGLSRCGIDKTGPIVARCILLDVAQAKGLESLPLDYTITVEDLEATMEREGVDLRPGDAVLIRTGMYAVWQRDPAEWAGPHPGLGVEAAQLLGEKDVVLIGADNRGIEPLPKQKELPVHRMLLRGFGINHLELMYLEELGRDEVWESLLVVAPLRITGGSGSPVSPFAIA